MEWLGFIAGFLLMVYFSLWLLSTPYIACLGGGLKGGQVVLWWIGVIALAYLWWVLFTYAPFSIVMAE